MTTPIPSLKILLIENDPAVATKFARRYRDRWRSFELQWVRQLSEVLSA